MPSSFDFHRAYQAIWTRLAPYRNLDPRHIDAADPFHALFLKALEAHLEAERHWHETLRQNANPPVGVFLAAEHAKLCVTMQRAIVANGETPPLVGARFEKSGWLDIGLSALLLELLSVHVGAKMTTTFEQGRFAAMADGFAIERAYALRASVAEPRVLEAGIAEFVVPAVRMYGDSFLREAYDVLWHRLPKRTALRAIVNAFREAGMPDDLWLYLEPQLMHHASVFDLKLTGVVGRMKKYAIKTAIHMLVSSSRKGDSDVE